MSARELASAAADNLANTLARHSDELPLEAQARHDAYVGRAASFEAAVKYAISILRNIASEGEK